MNKDQIISKVKTLGWSPKSYIVFGSGPMAAAGIRKSSDVDFLVTPELYKKLRTEGWQELVKNPDDKPLVFEDFEAHDNWNFTSYKPTLEHLLSTATVIDGIPFASLEEVRKWKVSSARPKDLADIKLIDDYLKKKTS